MTFRVILNIFSWGILLPIGFSEAKAQGDFSTTEAVRFSSQPLSFPECQPAINTSFSPSLIEDHRVQFLPDSLNPYLDYFWDFGDGYVSYEINPVHTYWNNGLYQVCLTISDTSLDCSSSFCAEMQLNTTSIEESNALGSGLRIGPNPIKNHLLIAWDKVKEPWTAQIFTLSGKLIAQFESNNQEYIWPEASQLASGSYLIRIQTGNQQDTRLLIKH